MRGAGPAIGRDSSTPSGERTMTSSRGPRGLVTLAMKGSIVERSRATGKSEQAPQRSAGAALSPKDRFAELIDRADQGSLDFDGLRELGREYRIATSRLSEHKARARTRDPEALRYLNALCVRAYTHLYVPAARSNKVELGFWLQDLPAALART